MSIQIVDNFQVNIGKAIDNRFVVGPSQFYTNKDSIPYKYAGMRVWDLNIGAPFVWTGTTFSTEASGSVSGSGTPNYIPKFVSPGNVIQNSLIFDNATNVGIGTAVPDKKLTVNGAIRSISSGFYGIGTNITNISATNITTGTLTLSRIQNGTINYILTSGGGSPNWTDPTSITVGNSTNTSNINLSLETTGTSDHYLPFSTSTTGNNALKTNTNLKFKPSFGGASGFQLDGFMSIGTSLNSSQRLRVAGDAYVSGNIGIGTNPNAAYKIQTVGDVRLIGGRILVENGTESEPSHTFYGDTNTGFYRDGTDAVSLSLGGVRRWRWRLGGATDFEFYSGATLVGSIICWPTYLEISSDLTCGQGLNVNGTFKLPNAAYTAGLGNYAIAAISSATGQIVYTPYFLNNAGISDETLKKNINSVTQSYGIMDLNPVKFEWKDTKGMTNKEVNIGLIAQEVKDHIPEAVWLDESDGKYNIQWGSIITMLIKTVQEQQVEIDNLKNP